MRFSSFSKSKINSFLKIIAFGVMGYCLLLFLSSLVFDIVLKNKLTKIDHLTTQKIKTSWHCQSVSLENINYSKKDTLDIQAEHLNLIDIEWIDLLLNQKIKFEKITGSNGSYKSHHQPPKNKSAFDISDYLFSVNKLKLNNFNISINHENLNLGASNNSLGIENLIVSKNNISFDNVKFESHQLEMNAKKSAYQLSLDSISLDQKNMYLYSFNMQPKFTKKQWEQKFTYKKPRTIIKIPVIKIDHIDYDKLLNKQQVDIDEIVLQDAFLKVLTNENKKPDPAAYKPFLQELLLTCPIPLDIKQILLKNNRIDIDIKSKSTKNYGLVYFNKINAIIKNIQNKENHIINTKLHAQVLGKSRLDLDIDFHTQPKLFPYTIKGKMAAFNFDIFNGFLYLYQRIKITSGQCDRLEFTINGNNNLASGKITLDYQNIKMGLLEDGTKYNIKDLPSFLINKLLINTHNTPGDTKYKKGKMYYLRPKNRSMFHSWWYTLRSGFQSVILPNLVNPDELDN